MKKQHTLKTTVACKGVGVHSGQIVTLTLHPAPLNHGVKFIRTDLKSDLIPAQWNCVTETTLCTKITNEQGASVSTVEHLMAALAGLKIDNVTIEVDGPEVPIMDGSSAPFVSLIKKAGVIPQNGARQFLKIKRPVLVTLDENRWARLMPYDGFSIEFDFVMNRGNGQTQSFHLKDVERFFAESVSDARTFGFIEDAEKLKAMGLAKGASLDNAVVFDGDKVLNTSGLRHEDECVRHKVLDAVGDLYMAGAPLLGHFHGSQSGHGLNNKLLKEVFSDAANYEWVTVSSSFATPKLKREIWAESAPVLAPIHG